jgi:hypothetical protein
MSDNDFDDDDVGSTLFGKLHVCLEFRTRNFLMYIFTHNFYQNDDNEYYYYYYYYYYSY